MYTNNKSNKIRAKIQSLRSALIKLDRDACCTPLYYTRDRFAFLLIAILQTLALPYAIVTQH